MVFQHQSKRFHHETGKPKSDQKKIIGLQCLHNIPRHVTFLRDNRINFNVHKNLFRDLDVDPKSKTWFPNKYIEADIKKKLDKPEDNLKVTKWKMILDITLNILITTSNG